MIGGTGIAMPGSPDADRGAAGSIRNRTDALVGLIARRLLLGDEVAAAKFGTGVPIDDPDRERQLLAEVAEKSLAIGLDPAFSVRFFRAQIDANKVVQAGLHERWASSPKSRPRRRPDLTAEIRPRVDEINAQLLDQLTRMAPVPRVDGELPTFDKLHCDALRIALAPVQEADAEREAGRQAEAGRRAEREAGRQAGQETDHHAEH